MEGMETETNGGGAAVATKRQRRPSVRLGDIGGGVAAGGDAHHLHHFYYSDNHAPRGATKPQSKSRPLRNPRSTKQTLADDVNINNNNNGNNNGNGNNKKKKKTSSSGGSGSLENDEDAKEGDFGGGGGGDGVAIGSSNIGGDLKSKRGLTNAKGARSNWASSTLNQTHKCVDDGTNRNFEPLNSDEELEEEEEEEEEEDKEDQQLVDDDDNASPMHSFDNNDNGNNHDTVNDNGVHRERRRGIQIMEEMEPPSDLRNTGVRAWLNKLGLERYAPVFEIHEVDAEVLPLLTLDDLKDMGISAVGSRRKMYCSIQKLNKGFS